MEQIDRHYELIKDKFEYTVKTQRRIDRWLSLSPFAIIVGFLIMIISSLDIFSGNFVRFLKWMNIQPGISLSSLILILLFVGAIFSIVLMVMWEKSINKYGLSFQGLPMCYAYYIKRELETFIATKKPMHLAKIPEYFKLAVADLRGFNSDGRYYNIAGFINGVREFVPWVKISDETISLGACFNKIEVKVNEHLKRQTELPQLLKLFDLLARTLKAKQQLNELNEKGENVYVELLKELGEMMKNLKMPEKVLSEINAESNSIISRAFSLLTELPFLGLFACWTTIVVVLFCAIGTIVYIYFGWKLEPMEFWTALTGATLLGVTIAATIKKKTPEL